MKFKGKAMRKSGSKETIREMPNHYFIGYVFYTIFYVFSNS